MMRLIFLFLFQLLFLTSFQAFSQLEIAIKGTVVRYGKKCEGAIVKLVKDGKVENTIRTSSNGKFQFLLTEVNHEYIIEVSKPEHVTVKIGISTKLPPQKTKEFIEGEFIFPVSIVERFEGVDVSFLKEPIATIKFLPKENRFDHDHSYFDSIKAKWEKLMSDAQNLNYIGKKPITEAVARNEELKVEAEKKAKADAQAKIEADRLQKEEYERKKREEIERKRAEEERLAKELTAKKLKAEQQEQNQKETIQRSNTDLTKEVVKGNASKKTDPTKEEEVLRLANEKKEREALIKKNQSVKAAYESELIKAAAENERRLNETEFNKLKSATQNNAIVERIKKEEELKLLHSPILSEMNLYHALYQENKVVKVKEFNSLMETVAIIEKSNKINTPSKMRVKEKPSMIVLTEYMEDGLIKTNYITSFEINGKSTVLKKVVYFWGDESYYKNEAEIDIDKYQNELNKLK